MSPMSTPEFSRPSQVRRNPQGTAALPQAVGPSGRRAVGILGPDDGLDPSGALQVGLLLRPDEQGCAESPLPIPRAAGSVAGADRRPAPRLPSLELYSTVQSLSAAAHQLVTGAAVKVLHRGEAWKAGKGPCLAG